MSHERRVAVPSAVPSAVLSAVPFPGPPGWGPGTFRA